MTQNTLPHSVTCHFVSAHPPTPPEGKLQRGLGRCLTLFLNLSPLGLAHGRHLINISWLNEARSADSRLWGNNLLSLNTDLSQVSRCSYWSLLYCSLCMAVEGRELSWAGSLPLLTNCSSASLCQWVASDSQRAFWLLYASNQPRRFGIGFSEP